MFDWQDYLKLAEELNTDKLQNSSIKEAYYRTIISRFYYGILGIAKIKSGITTKSAVVHKEVFEYFQKQNHLHCKQIAQILDSLRKERNKCDYDAEETIGEKEATYIYEKCQIFLELINQT